MAFAEYSRNNLLPSALLMTDVVFRGLQDDFDHLIIVLILLLIGALPRWPYSSGWGYGPGGLVGTILIVVILALLGKI
jgi:Protein of unknown function (DUF3309)